MKFLQSRLLISSSSLSLTMWPNALYFSIWIHYTIDNAIQHYAQWDTTLYHNATQKRTTLCHTQLYIWQYIIHIYLQHNPILNTLHYSIAELQYIVYKTLLNCIYNIIHNPTSYYTNVKLRFPSFEGFAKDLVWKPNLPSYFTGLGKTEGPMQ